MLGMHGVTVVLAHPFNIVRRRADTLDERLTLAAPKDGETDENTNGDTWQAGRVRA